MKKKKENSDYREYLEELKNYYLESQKDYQKTIFTIAGGSLTVSLTFTEKTISDSNIFINSILVAGWISLLFAVVNQIVYYLNSNKYITDLIEKTESYIISENDKYIEDIQRTFFQKKEKLEQNSKRSLWLLLTGLSFISIYFITNIYNKNTNNCQNKNCQINPNQNINIQNSQIINQTSSFKTKPQTYEKHRKETN